MDPVKSFTSIPDGLDKVLNQNNYAYFEDKLYVNAQADNPCLVTKFHAMSNLSFIFTFPDQICLGVRCSFDDIDFHCEKELSLLSVTVLED